MNFIKISGNIRAFLWPIQAIEVRKFLPMSLMMLFILLNYSILRSIKDGLIMNNIGAEAIGFLKLYVVLPLAVLTIVIYTKLCNLFSQDTVFYLITGFFLFFFSLFTFLIYPNISALHFSTDIVSELVQKYPHFQWFIKIIASWGYSLFYAFSELWGSVMLSLLFWQFANRVVPTIQAKRFYPMFGLVSNIGSLSLPLILLLLKAEIPLFTNSGKYTPVLCLVMLFNVVILGLYRYITYYVGVQDVNILSKTTKAKKPKLSIVDSFKLILSSKYLGMLVILVISYGISINLVENTWKKSLSEVYTTEESYSTFMGNLQAMQGAVSVIFMLIGGYILRNVSWKIAAMMTPIVILLTGGVFFSLMIFDKHFGQYVATYLGLSTLSMAVFFGTLQNLLSKATKYSLFDSTKEMAYIPLSSELKTKGKAAVDVLGGRFGKSGGGLIQSTVFILLPGFSFKEAAPFFAGIFVFMLILWVYAIHNIGIDYQKKILEKSE